VPPSLELGRDQHSLNLASLRPSMNARVDHKQRDVCDERGQRGQEDNGHEACSRDTSEADRSDDKNQSRRIRRDLQGLSAEHYQMIRRRECDRADEKRCHRPKHVTSAAPRVSKNYSRHKRGHPT